MPLGWLVGYTIASMVGALFVVKALEWALSGVVGVVGAVKNTLFVSTWTAIMTVSGMRAFSKKVRRLRKSPLVSIEGKEKE